MTLVGEPFVHWVKQRVDARHKKVAEDAEMYINMDQEINEVFRNSKAVSGKSWALSSSFIFFIFYFLLWYS